MNLVIILIILINILMICSIIIIHCGWYFRKILVCALHLYCICFEIQLNACKQTEAVSQTTSLSSLPYAVCLYTEFYSFPSSQNSKLSMQFYYPHGDIKHRHYSLETKRFLLCFTQIAHKSRGIVCLLLYTYCG